jgi:hypothetical protein
MRTHTWIATAVSATALTVAVTGLVPWLTCALAAAFVLTALGLRRIS